ncbi:MAG TPA: LamG domain-containing protein [Sedimentisphaerales bacterium]|nr:LamG domain-containing protein [Sedimentisphaerales bacterium]
MRSMSEIERLARQIRIEPGATVDSRVLAAAEDVLVKSQARGAAPPSKSLWRAIMRSRIMRIAAAAVIIAAALIGMKVLFGLGEQRAAVPVAQPASSDEVVEGSDSPVDIELKQVRQMYAAGDVKGLAGMLAEGEFESKVLAANLLAQMDNGAEALGALEKVQAEYGKDDPGNPFTLVVEKIRRNNESAARASSPAVGVSRGQRQTEPRPAAAAAPSVQAPSERQTSGTAPKLSVQLTREIEENTDEVLADSEVRPELVGGVSGHAYYFDGVNDYIALESAGPLGNSPRTVCAWAATSSASGQVILSYGGLGANKGSQFRAGLSGWGDCEGVTLDIADGAVTYSSEVADGNWHHYAFVVPNLEDVNLAEVRVYQDGAMLEEICGSIMLDRVLNTENTNPIRIGRYMYEPRCYFEGFIDEVAVFDRGLSDDEIRQIYENSGRLRGNEAGLVGYWNFDRDEGDVVRDMGPYGNNGKLGGW